VFFVDIVGVSLKSDGPIEQVQHMVSYTTYGIVFGLLYPISYPGCALYTLYKNLNIK